MWELLFSSPIPLLLLCPDPNSKRSSVNVQCTACTDSRRAKQRWGVCEWPDDRFCVCSRMYRNVQYSFFFRATGAPSHSVGEEQGIGGRRSGPRITDSLSGFFCTESTEFGVQPCCTGSVEVAAATSRTSRSAESPQALIAFCCLHYKRLAWMMPIPMQGLIALDPLRMKWSSMLR